MKVIVVVTSSSVARQLLELLKKYPQGYPWGIAGLAREMQVSYPWLHQVLKALEYQGVVEIDRSRRPYRIRLRAEG